jgi:hypothetical protein
MVTCWGFKLENHLNKYAGEGGFSQKHGIPFGYSSPYAWGNPLKGGGLASKVEASAEVSKALLANGLYATATILASGDVANAYLVLTTALAASILGLGGVADAQLAGIVSLLATIAGYGDITDAALNLIVNMQATIGGLDSLDALLVGLAFCAAHIYVNEGAATVTQIVDGVWDALAVDHDLPGTMGQKLNAAGAAADPLLNPVPGTYAPGTAGYIIGTNLDLDAISDAVRSMLLTNPPQPSGAVVLDGGNTALAFKTNLAETSTNYWKDTFCVFLTGGLAGQVKLVTAYNGTSKVLTVKGGFTGVPGDGNTFALVNK